MTTKEQSLERLIDYRAEMALPTGRTCSDCRHIRRCTGFGFTKPERTSCDFHPSRFLLSSLKETSNDHK